MPADRCAECGFNFREDRASLVARCGDFPEVVKDVLESTPDERIRARPVPSIQYAAHVGDALCWYAQRIRRVLDEDFPKLEPFDFDAAADSGEYRRRSIDTVLTDLRAACSVLANIARPVSDRQLIRFGLGSDGSPRSVALLLARAHHELVHHELDLRRGVGPPGKVKCLLPPRCPRTFDTSHRCPCTHSDSRVLDRATHRLPSCTGLPECVGPGFDSPRRL